MSRQGILYFRITVPNHLQSLLNKKEIRRSLGTSKRREARAKAIRLAAVAQDYFFLAEQYLNSKEQSLFPKDMQHIEKNVNMIIKHGTLLFDNALEPGTISPQLAALFPDTEKASMLTHIPGCIPEGVDEIQKIPEIQTEQNSADRVTVRSCLKIQPNRLEPLEKIPISIPMISQAAEAYIAAKKLTWSPSSIKDIPPQIKQFTEIIIELEQGRKDILLTQLTRDHIRRYFDTLRNLPHRVNGKKEFRKKSWLSLAEMGRSGFNGRLLSEKTLSVRQNNVRSFINWCELEYRGIIQARYLNTGFPKAATDNDLRRKGVQKIKNCNLGVLV
ncbi:hypothetical protein C4J81_06865 [Deltaproteobacteria bacterium Smac51]|nr:hypothetical protein C4J81_06865 [Deltaproteobacteria bacterium Smac51]